MDDAIAKVMLWLTPIGLALTGFFMRRMVNQIDDANKLANQNGRDLDAFKLHVSDTYSKEQNTQTSLGRIHDRIDDSNERIESTRTEVLDAITTSKDEIRQDIRALFSKKH